MKIHLFSNSDVLTAFLWVGSMVILLSGLKAQTTSTEEPNIILILADDMGYGDAGCYGGKVIPTPNIDRLAKDGILCASGYVTASLCAPSRCGLLTGAYNQRFGINSNSDHGRPWYKIPPTQKLLPEALAAAGYITGHFGKWNIPRDAKTVFAEVYDLMDFVGVYFPNDRGEYAGVDGVPMDKQIPLGWVNLKKGEEYLTDRITRHAMEFVDKHEKEKFFMYVAYNAPHVPLQANEIIKEAVAHIKEEPLQVYYAMIASMDQGIGALISHLEEKRLLQNTLICFTSDNGPSHGGTTDANWPSHWPDRFLLGSAGPLNAHKGTVFEGGIRVPFIVHWPQRLKGGQVYHQPVSTMDLYPTVCEAAGTGVPNGTITDGVSLIPFLEGKGGVPHGELFWKMWNAVLKENMWAAREGDWKIVVPPENKKAQDDKSSDGKRSRVQLYNLKEDIGEKKNVAESHPGVVKKLTDDWNAWNSSMPVHE